MSSPGNGITNHSNDCAEYAPPEYSIVTVSQMCNNHDKPLDDYPPPPAYDTLTDLPAWCVSPSAPQANTSAINQTHTPTCNIPSTPTMLSAPPDAPLQTSFTVTPQGTSSSATTQQSQMGRTRAIGSWLILISIVQIGVSGGLAMNVINNKYFYSSELISYGIPFWTAAFNIFTGIMTLAAYARPTTCLVISSFSCHIITLIVAFVGILFTSLDLGNIRNINCYIIGIFYNNCVSFTETVSIMYYVIIAGNVLVMLFAISFTFMGCRALCRASQ